MSLTSKLTAEQKRFIRFCIVGASGVVVNLGFVAIGVEIFSDYTPEIRDFMSLALGILVSILSNFFLNDYWTWGDRQKGGRKRDFAKRISSYALGAGIGGALQFGISVLLYSSLGTNIYLAQLAGIAVGTVVNYVINNRLVFKDQVVSKQEHT